MSDARIFRKLKRAKPATNLGGNRLKTRKRLKPDIHKIEKTRLFELDELKPHEDVDPSRVARLKARIETDGMLKLAIAVDVCTRVILDGHHRLAVLRQIGCKRIPVTFVDYSSPLIEVISRKGLPLTKSEIIQAGLRGRLYPPKTSKHMVRFSNKTRHISAIEEKVNVPLSLLKDRRAF
jgi:hypothetical protein